MRAFWLCLLLACAGAAWADEGEFNDYQGSIARALSPQAVRHGIEVLPMTVCDPYTKQCRRGLLVQGQFTGRADLDRLKQAARQHGKPGVVAFDSGGGSNDGALAISDWLWQEGIDTQVSDGQGCLSACVFAFAGGHRRATGAKAMVGVHRMSDSTQSAAIAQLPDPEEQTKQIRALIEVVQERHARIAAVLNRGSVSLAIQLAGQDTPARRMKLLGRSCLQGTGLDNTQGVRTTAYQVARWCRMDVSLVPALPPSSDVGIVQATSRTTPP